MYMKKQIVALSMLSISAFADSGIPIPVPTDHQIQVSPDFVHKFENSKSTTVGVGWLKEERSAKRKMDGDLTGVKIGYDYSPENSFYAGADVSYLTGKVYDLISTEGFKSTTRAKESVLNVEGRVGYNLALDYVVSVTPFLGFGGYHILDRLEGVWISSGAFYSFLDNRSFSSHSLYGSAGLRLSYELKEGVSFGLNLKGTKELSHNDKPWGYEVEAPIVLNWAFKPVTSLHLSPYFKKMDTKSTMNMIGLRLAVCCGF
jgi:hypothetical protein